MNSFIFAFALSPFVLFRRRSRRMKVAIEDLEALKELNDQLEENHVETEKQLLAEIGER